jgi:segregation and condensation protein A
MSAAVETAPRADFEVHLGVYDGPFEALLGLIGKHRLDITEVALAQVTDEFIAYARAGGFDLEQTTAFLVVAATLLDLKTSRLLPGADDGDDEDLALLEARDLLFARLLQYRAFQQVAGWLATEIASTGRWLPRQVALPPELRMSTTTVELGLDAAGLAALAALAEVVRVPDLVDTDHVHAPRVSVREAVATLSEMLHALGSASFRTLCRDCGELVEVVARFLALLELFRDGHVRFEQVAPLGDLHVVWAPSPEGS